MYEVKVKGRNLIELTKAVGDIYKELSNGKFSGRVDKDLTEVKEVPVVELSKGEVEIKEVVESTNAAFPSEVEADSEGHHYDSRIHSAGKTKTVKGVWKLRKNVDKNLVAQVLQAQKTIAQPVAMLSAHVVNTAPVEVAQPVFTAPVEVAQPVFTAPVEVAQPVVMPSMVSSGHTVETFSQNFPMIVATLIGEKKIDQAYVNSLKTYFKVDEIWQASDSQKVEAFNAFVQSGVIQKVG